MRKPLLFWNFVGFSHYLKIVFPLLDLLSLFIGKIFFFLVIKTIFETSQFHHLIPIFDKTFSLSLFWLPFVGKKRAIFFFNFLPKKILMKSLTKRSLKRTISPFFEMIRTRPFSLLNAKGLGIMWGFQADPSMKTPCISKPNGAAQGISKIFSAP